MTTTLPLWKTSISSELFPTFVKLVKLGSLGSVLIIWCTKGFKKLPSHQKGMCVCVYMCHSLALATLATVAQMELKKQQVWTPLGLSDELTYTNTQHLDSISTCWFAHNHHPFFSLTPHTLSKDPGAFPSPNQVAKGKKKNFVSNKSPPIPTHTTHHFCHTGGLPSPAVALAFTI